MDQTNMLWQKGRDQKGEKSTKSLARIMIVAVAVGGMQYDGTAPGRHLVLYADWGSWSKNLLNESPQDPRLKALQDRLVWIKVNSDKQKDAQAKYRQKGGFP